MFATVTVWAEKSTVLEQVIYDENNIKVSVSEASLDAEQNIVIPLHIENNTDEKMGLIAENCYINGCKVEANSLFFDRAEPGGETDDYWWFRNRNVMDMELTVWRMWNVACVFMRIRRMMILL